MKLMNCLCLLYDAWVVVVHTVDICPYLDLVSEHSCTDERSCIVRTTTLKVVNLTISVAAYKALSDVYLIALVCLKHLCEILLDEWSIRLCVLVGTHEVERIKKDRLNALLFEVVHNHVSAHNLTLCNDDLLLETCEDILCE